MQLKVRFADFSLITRSRTLPEPTNITEELRRGSSLRGESPRTL